MLKYAMVLQIAMIFRLIFNAVQHEQLIIIVALGCLNVADIYSEIAIVQSNHGLLNFCTPWIS